MHRATASLLFFALLLCQTEVRQVLRIPTLVVHYCEHRAEDPGEDLNQFLASHYGTSQPLHHDEHDDALPFKADQGSAQSVVALEPFEYSSVHRSLVPTRNVAHSSYRCSLPQSPCAEIFQPPRP